MITLHNHTTDPLRYLSFRGTPKGKIYYGVELEVECQGVDAGRGLTFARQPYMRAVVDRLGEEFVIIKHDGSLAERGAGGFEIVSAPASLTVHRVRWGRFFNALPEGLMVSPRCGMHVHVSREPLTREQIGRMLVFVNEPANDRFITAMAGRTAEYYAKRIKKSFQDVFEGGGLGHDDPRRYEAVNLTRVSTVEMRIFAATLKAERFFANLEFVVALVEWTAGEVRLEVEEFKAWVMANAKRFPNLDGWLRRAD